MTGAELRAIRTALNLSQEQMATRIGRSLRQYKAYELGEFAIPLVVEIAVTSFAQAQPSNQQKDPAT